MFTLDPLGTDDRFLTNSIPVGVATSGEAKRTNISARASRLNMEFRTPGGAQEERAFFEGDFAVVITVNSPEFFVAVRPLKRTELVEINHSVVVPVIDLEQAGGIPVDELVPGDPPVVVAVNDVKNRRVRMGGLR